ncbi:hypothetical protein OKA05_17865 [Luteolibacter arcticus]|uniref:PA14 domain-containing protein n=1 Tax=Luteolibacter arcticus TaxID=1581411 RepID=A0ABT3GLP0_9BACT|nr:hypothetical protein [Luteolibacter arcticus]MCW1924438.1 hypothetical protein [Luteolibacter arcticus]
MIKPHDNPTGPAGARVPLTNVAGDMHPVTGGNAGSRTKKGLWQRLGGSAFSISVLVHAVFILLAIFFFIRWVEPPPEERVDFVPGGGGGGNNGSEVTHKIQQKARQMPSAVSKRIASTSLTAAFTLPDSSSDLPDATMPMEMGASAAGKGGGAGGGSGTGIGTGTGSGVGPGSGPGVGKGFIDTNPFGSKGGVGLVGTFYDFKRDKKGDSTGVRALDRPTYTKIVNDFTNSSRWGPSSKFKHYTSPTQLTAKVFAFKGIPDTSAGQAFQCPDTGAGMWLAHYSGTVKATETGTYRFVGWGDNCLVVGIDGKVVLDASDVVYTGKANEPLGSINLPGKPGAALACGKWFQLRQGSSLKVDIIMGDEGGIFSAGVMIEKKDSTYGRGPGGVPVLPVLTVADLEEKEKALYPFLSAESFPRSLFVAETPRLGAGDIFK